jgi:asparagine synthetase B (glutamine-hydrolysing)
MRALDGRGTAKGPDAGFAAVVGDPVVKNGGTRRFSDRSGDVEYLRHALDDGAHNALADACGTFAGVHLHPDGQTLSLFVDKIGVRNLYVAVTPDAIVFATALRILEGMSVVPKRLDTASLIEQVALHSPMGRSTPYLGISLLGPAEVLICKDSSMVPKTYWHWSDTAPLPIEQQLDECHRSFLSAIESRLTPEKSSLAFLSGGLDSRVIVGGLRESGATVDTVNFAPPGTQDQVFARQFAERIGSRHREVPFDQVANSEQIMVVVSDFLSSNAPSTQFRPARSIWSGNGGSVGVGHVYMSETIVEHMRAGRLEDAVAAYMADQGQSVTRRPLKGPVFAKYADSPRKALVAELEGIQARDPARAFYQFLMHNDQRRSLSAVYEDIDVHGLEFVLPFFDSDFLSAIYRIPIEQCIGHEFYNRWLHCFTEPVWNTPWQSYPGHVPCPIKAPDDLGYQFDEGFSRDWDRLIRERRLGRAKAMLVSRRFPTQLISKSVIRIAAVLCQMGSERLSYAIDKGYEYFRYAEKTSV